MDKDPVQLNVDGVRQLVGSGLNKSGGGSGSSDEGVEGDYIDVLSLKMEDSELIALALKWEDKYKGYEQSIKTRQNRNKTYYLGQQKQGYDGRDIPVSSNLLFEAEETFIPAALAKNPEPVVWADNTAEGKEQSNLVKTMLQYHADVLVLRRKLGLMVRHWSLYMLGAIKHGWDEKVSDITSDVIFPQNLVLDPDATIDVYGNYDGAYLGERKKCDADELIKRFPKKKALITIMAEGKMGTEMQYTEWSTNDYCFYTMRGKILDKHKNITWNWDETVEEDDGYGGKVSNTREGKNHFARPKIPYTFLSVFTLGETPHDVTTLIEQNIPQQDLVNKRIDQIDMNLDRGNNSIVFSDQHFTAETAKQGAMAMQKGNPILASGDIRGAVERFPAANLPGDAFNQLNDMTDRLRSIFGTQGISAAGQQGEETARGKILNQQFDSTRIGGGIGDALEQVADNIFNWWVQLYYVFYDEPHEAAILGKGHAVEYVTLRAQDMQRKIVVSVAPNSMKPKDEITRQNLAMDLWSAKALDPISLYTELDFPDPMESAKKLVMWTTNPQQYAMTYFPETQPQPPGMSPQQGAGVDQNIPPEQSGTLAANSASPALSQVPMNTAGMPQ